MRTPPGVLHGPGLTDVRMMVVAHSSFRRELMLAVPAVRGTAAGDVRRRRVVADHVELFLDSLEHHHTIEDDLLWEPLAARVPQAVVSLVALMQEQHEGVHAHLAETRTLMRRWRSDGEPGARDALAQALENLVIALCQHLDTEEERVLPLMARHVTAAEWEEFTRQGMGSIPPRLMLVGFGMMLYEGDPEAIAGEVRKLPAPLRPFLPILGRWAYRRYARRLHGTGTPRRTGEALAGTAVHGPRTTVGAATVLEARDRLGQR